MKTREFEYPLDKEIERKVHILMDGGIETFESCEGGSGHPFPEPTIRFHGDRHEGFKALTIAMQHDLNVSDLFRIWQIVDGEPTGPWWEIRFLPTMAP